MRQFISLKRFGGGSKLRTIHGSGVGRLVQQGTIMNEIDFNGASHIKDLEGKGLITEYDSKETYVTQADKELRAKEQRRQASTGEKPAKPKAEKQAK